MHAPSATLLPLTAGFVFAIAAILTKRAMEGGLGPWRMTVVNAWLLALAFAPFALMPGAPFAELRWHHPVLIGLAALGGNLLMFLAFSRGEVSVAAPIMGSKVLFVALLTVWLLGEAVPPAWWLAAGCATAGIFFLRTPSRPGAPARLGLTLALATASAGCFAVSDVLIQKWVTPATFFRIMPVSMLVAALASLLVVPRFRAGLQAIPWRTWRALLPGGLLVSLQAVLFIGAIAWHGNATAMNVLYNSRGIWSVLIVWVAGHWFRNVEAEAGHRAMAGRLAGALLLVVAVVLVLATR